MLVSATRAHDLARVASELGAAALPTPLRIEDRLATVARPTAR